MATVEKGVRQSVTLPARVARRVKSLAKTKGRSANRIIVELIESVIEARQQEKKRVIDLADRFARSRHPAEQSRIKEELAVMTLASDVGRFKLPVFRTVAVFRAFNYTDCLPKSASSRPRALGDHRAANAAGRRFRVVRI